MIWAAAFAASSAVYALVLALAPPQAGLAAAPLAAGLASAALWRSAASSIAAGAGGLAAWLLLILSQAPLPVVAGAYLEALGALALIVPLYHAAAPALASLAAHSALTLARGRRTSAA